MSTPDFRALSDRALLELVFTSMNGGFDRVEKELDGVKRSLAGLTGSIATLAGAHEATAGRVDALIDDTRAMRSEVRGQFTIARDRIRTLEEANGRRVAGARR